ncbi:MAG: hypothetical protein WBQ25_13575 [Nitrososphaeraceae archaeon]
MSEFFDTNIITYALISFLLGALAMLIYYKIKSRFKASYLANIGVIDTIVSQYKQRLDQFEDIINELKINMNLLESKLSNNSGNNAKIINHVIDDPTSQQISQHFEGGNELPESKHVIKGSNDPKISVSNGYFHTSDTLETILELLLNGPLTSRDIQRGIGRTREHTSRVMKKLYELKYVDRDINHKPFKYNITDLGRLQTYNHALSNNESTISVNDKSTRY